MITKIDTYGLKMVGLKKIASASKALTGAYGSRYFQIFYDTSDGRVFYNDHCSPDGHSVYDDADIIGVMNTYDPVTMQEIADKINEKMNAL